MRFSTCDRLLNTYCFFFFFCCIVLRRLNTGFIVKVIFSYVNATENHNFRGGGDKASCFSLSRGRAEDVRSLTLFINRDVSGCKSGISALLQPGGKAKGHKQQTAPPRCSDPGSRPQSCRDTPPTLHCFHILWGKSRRSVAARCDQTGKKKTSWKV